MIRKFEIWNSEISDEFFNDVRKEMEQDFGEGITDDECWERCDVMNQEYLADEICNLDIQLENPILIIADLGLWHGRRPSSKLIESGNIKDIFSSQVRGTSDQRWYCDGYNICCDEIHHDGTNHYIYREIRNPDNIETLMGKLYHGEDVSKLLNYYTRSLAKDVGRIYGHC